MYNFLKTAIVSTVAFSTVATAAPAVSQAQTITATVKSNATIYKAANKKKVVKTIKKSTKVTVLGTVGSLTHVKYGKSKKDVGYILTKYLKIPPTEAQLENTAITKGKGLLKKVADFNEIAEAGNITELYDSKYDDLSKKTTEYIIYVDGLKVSSEVKKKLKEQYVNVALNMLERYSKEIDTWRYIVQTQGRIKNFKYNTAQKSYDDAVTAFAEGEALRKEKGYEALPEKLEKTLKAQIEVLNNRFEKSTYEQMRADGHSYAGDYIKDFEFITAQNPFKSVDGKTFTNGFKTLKGFKSNGQRHVKFEKGTFKKMSFTVALGDYWNTHDFKGEIKVSVAGKTYKLSDGDDSITAQIDISEKSTIYFKPNTTLNDVAFTNIVFYR